MSAQTRDLGVEYPVAVDNDYTVWRAFDNHFWPALYLADVEGRVRYHHFGEGEYAMIEMAVQQLLLEAGADDLDQDLVVVEPRGLEVAADWPTLGSPETYLGYAQGSRFASATRARFDTAHRYAAAPRLPLNYWDLSGTWTVAQEAAVLQESVGRIAFQFEARDVNLVMGPAAGFRPIPFRVFLDGRPWTAPPVPMSRPTAREPSTSSAPTSWSASRGRPPNAGSKSSSPPQAPRRTASPSADSPYPTRTRRSGMPTPCPPETTPGLG